MLETRLQQQFFESADLLYQAAEQLTKPLSTAAQMMVASLTAGSRLLCAGSGLAQADAEQFAALLLSQFEQERPGLAAIALTPQLGGLQGMAALSRQVQTLGHPGDLLLWLDPEGDPETVALLAAARAQDMAVVAITGPDAPQLRQALSDTDVLVQLAPPRLARRLARAGRRHRCPIARTGTLMKHSLIAIAAASLLSACAPLVVGGAVVGTAMVATDRRTTGTQVEDKGIELKAASRIREAMGSRSNINVQAFNRALLLSGEVRNEEDKAEAERIARGVENVARVHNELQVGFLSSLTSRSSDLVLAGKIKATLIDAKALQSHAFTVVVERGEVYLMGIVTEREANLASELIRGIPKVEKVVRLFEIISEEELAKRVPKKPTAEQAR